MLKHPKKQFQFEFSRDKHFHRGFQQKVRLANDIENMPFLRSKHETTGAIRKKDRRDRGNDWYQPHIPGKSWKFRCRKRHQWERHFHPVCEFEHSRFLDKQHLGRALLEVLSQAHGWTIVDTVSSSYAKYNVMDALLWLLDKHLLELGDWNNIPNYALTAPYSILLNNGESKLWKRLFRPYETLLGHNGDVEYKLPCGNGCLNKGWWWLWEIRPIVRVVQLSDSKPKKDDDGSQDTYFPSEAVWKCLGHYEHHLKREFSLGLSKGTQDIDYETTLALLKAFDSYLQDRHSPRELLSLICRDNKTVHIHHSGRKTNR